MQAHDTNSTVCLVGQHPLVGQHLLHLLNRAPSISARWVSEKFPPASAVGGCPLFILDTGSLECPAAEYVSERKDPHCAIKICSTGFKNSLASLPRVMASTSFSLHHPLLKWTLHLLFEGGYFTCCRQSGIAQGLCRGRPAKGLPSTSRP